MWHSLAKPFIFCLLKRVKATDYNADTRANTSLPVVTKPGPEKYGERGNGVPRKIGTYQEVKANLAGRP